MRGTRALVIGFSLGLVVLAGAVAWLIRITLAVEAAEQAGRLEAAREERVRLALWRIDSSLAAFLAAENARPVDVPPVSAGLLPLERFELSATVASAAGVERDPLLERLGAEPLRAPAPPSRAKPVPATIEPGRGPAPQRPSDDRPAEPAPEAVPSAALQLVEDKEVAVLPGADLAANQNSQALLNANEFSQRMRVAEQQNQLAAILPVPKVADASKRRPEAMVLAPEPADGPASGPAAAEREPASQAPSTLGSDRSKASVPPAAGAPGPVAPDSLAGTDERVRTSETDRAGPLDRRGPVDSDAREAPESEQVTPPKPMGLQPSLAAAAPRRESGPTGRPGSSASGLGTSPYPARALSPIEAVWVDQSLVLARRIERDGGEALQGGSIGFEALAGELLPEVADLLPEATLAPLEPGAPADPGRRLALLPLTLDPGPLPLDPSGPAPLRRGLLLAVSAILLAAAVASASLLFGLRLARRRAEVASALVHELRTPLTSLRLYTEMLADGMVPETERQSYLETLRGQSDRLARLVENVLAFARLERGSWRDAPGIDDLGSVLSGIVERLELQLGREGHRLEHDLTAATGLSVAIDAISLERILENLATNSSVHGCCGQSPVQCAIEVERTSGGVLVRWRDDGVGIDRRARRRLFRAFQRGAHAATGGVGLGLALSRALARRAGGDLRLIDNGAASGAELTLELPTV